MENFDPLFPLWSFWKELDGCGLFIKDGVSLLDWREEVAGKILMQAIEALPFSVPLDDSFEFWFALCFPVEVWEALAISISKVSTTCSSL